MPRSVTAGMEKSWSASWPTFALPFQSSDARGSVVASVSGDDFTGIALINLSSGEIESRIDAFKKPDVYQAFGSADGAHAVWKEYQSKDLGRFAIKAWDRETSEVSTIGGSAPAGDGELYPVPLQAPIIAGDVAAWVEGSAADQSNELIAFDLSTGVRRVVRRGHVGWVSSFGRSIVWAESPTRGAKTTLYAVDSATLQPTTLPVSLEDVRGAGYLASDGNASAWIDTTTDPETGSSVFTLMVSPSPDDPARTVVTLRVGGFSPPLVVTPTSVVAQMSQGGAVMVDRRTGRYAVLKGVFGASQAGPDLLLSGSSTKYPTGALAVLTPEDAATIDVE